MISKVYKPISLNLFVAIFILIGCNSSIPITLQGVSPEAYFQGKKNLDSAYVADNFPLYDTWHLVAIGDPTQELLPFKYTINLNLTNEIDTLRPQYFTHRFKYFGIKRGYSIYGNYEFDTAGNIYISDSYSEKKIASPYRSYSSHEDFSEDNEWVWQLVITAEHYALEEEFLTLYSNHEVLIFTKRKHKNRSYYQGVNK